MSEDHSLADALAGCSEDKVKALVKERLDAGVPAAQIVAECNRGMAELGERFARGECFIPELMFGGMIMKSVVGELAPLLEGEAEVESGGKIVMGSVHHDVHDIGKDIVILMLRGMGFEVIDLGVDVPPEKFVEAVRQHQPAVVGMSVLLTTCFKSVVATVEAIREAGLRESVSLMVGGAAASDLLRESAGCDFYGKTAVDGAKFAQQAVGLS
ncbi:MAG: cobalamin-dependent protein [Pirellulales bacterium]|nr:cobalamin-dependent protein [Pirellulales bacterium]